MLMKKQGSVGNSGMTLCALLLGAASAHAQFNVLYSFGGEGDGLNPMGALTISGATLYGTTVAGGTGGNGNNGTVFQINTNGAGYNRMYQFMGWNNYDGSQPMRAMTLDNGTLYGGTTAGGYPDKGTVFKIDTNGTYGVLHGFGVGNTRGNMPYGALAISGSTLFGTTYQSDGVNNGLVFKMGTDGNDFNLLHEFSWSAQADGVAPGALTLAGSTLYGMAAYGGANNKGDVFKLNTDGSGFSVLHSFTSSDGTCPMLNALTLSGSTLYGLAYTGGNNNKGTVFKLDTDGTGFSVLHTFAGGETDGNSPNGALTLVGSTLFGTTISGGTNDAGTVFQLNTEGTDFQLLHSFAGGTEDGATPYDGLVYADGALYGTTYAGGANNGGVVYSLGVSVVPEPVSGMLVLAGLGVMTLVRRRRHSSRP